MEADTIKMLVESLVEAATGKLTAQVERCIEDCRKLENEIKELRSRVDFSEGADLKTKLDTLIENTQKLEINDAKQTEQLVTIFKQLDMPEQAKAAKEGINLNVKGPVGGIQTGPGGSQNVKQGE